MSQLSYSLSVREGKAGLIAYAGNGPKTIGTLNNPVDEIPFGRAVAKVSGADGQCELPDGSGADILGVAVIDSATENTSYVALSAVGYMSKGEIYVEVEEAVTGDDDVYVRHSGRFQVQTIVFSADIITGNTISVDIDGVTITQAFDTNNATTVAALAAKIQLEPGVSTAASNGTDTITVTSAVKGTDVVIDEEGITGGASQATITIAETVVGVADADRGLFRNDADSSTAIQITNARWIQGAAAGGFAILSINLA